MDKRGLGRGLSALIPETMAAEDTAQVREISVEKIGANPYQPRTFFDPEKMDDLVNSVREHGILQPVLVRRVGHEQYQLVAGERRFRAAQLAGKETVPALIREMSEQEQLEIAVVENLQREDIGPIEAARAYRRLTDDFGMTQEMVARRVGKSRVAITNTMRLLQLPEEVQNSVESGEITAGHARAILMAESPEAILRAWEQIRKRSVSVRDAERIARDVRQTRAPGAGALSSPSASAGPIGQGAESSPGGDANESDIVDRLQQALGTRVHLRRSSGTSGKIEIEFYSLEELERVVEVILHEEIR